MESLHIFSSNFTVDVDLFRHEAIRRLRVLRVEEDKTRAGASIGRFLTDAALLESRRRRLVFHSGSPRATTLGVKAVLREWSLGRNSLECLNIDVHKGSDPQDMVRDLEGVLVVSRTLQDSLAFDLTRSDGQELNIHWVPRWSLVRLSVRHSHSFPF